MATKKVTNKNEPDVQRRDFMVLAAGATAGMGAAAAAWPFIGSMQPAKDVLALASTEVNIDSMEPGQTVKTMWRGKPVFIRRRTPEEIEKAKAVKLTDLPDPEKDEQRVLEGKEEYLVVIGICTHLGCVPMGEAGEYEGWFCPCHGSHYDTSGRIRKGPAPKNMVVPPYAFTSDTVIKIG